MHTADLMRTHEFVLSRGGDRVGFHDLLPGFTVRDRLGIVALEPGDVLRAAPLLLAAVGAFYEATRAEETGDFYLYPDFFVFHVGGLTGRHSPLDVWPQSKEVVVPPDPQALLAAINDRGVTRLVLPNLPGAEGVVMAHAAQLAARRLRTVLTTAPGGGDPWTVRPSPAAVPMISRCARVSADLLGEERTARWLAEASSSRDYAELRVDEALSALCAVGSTDPSLGFSEEYRTRAGLGEGVLARDRYTVTAPPR